MEDILKGLNDKQYEVIFDGDYYKIISKETKKALTILLVLRKI